MPDPDDLGDVDAEIRFLEQDRVRYDEAAASVTWEEILAGGASAEEVLVGLARDNVNVFCEYVLKDEATGFPQSHQSPHHLEWQRLASIHKRLIIWSHVEGGKSIQLSVGRVLWLLGRNPNLRLVVVSETHALAKKIVRLSRKYIEESEELHRVFPRLRPAKNAPWTETYFFLDRAVPAKEPSLQAFGVGGRILGSRIDGVVLDDVQSVINTRTKELRDSAYVWYGNLVGRLTQDAFVLAVGNAIHPDDLLHRLSAQEPWVAKRFPVMDPEGRSTWPERWPDDRIAKRRQEYGPLEFARQMMCVARTDEDARFKKAWIDLCLDRGEGKTLTHALHTIPAGFRTITGVDLAVQQHASADLTVLFTILLHPDGTREVLDISSGRWAAPETIRKIIDAHERYSSLVIVENNAAQDFIVQMVGSSTAIPIRGFTTGRSKAHPEYGVELIGTEMANAKWIIPSRGGRAHPEIEAWINDMLYYDPKGHTGDRLMACYMACQGIKLGAIRAETGRVNW